MTPRGLFIVCVALLALQGASGFSFSGSLSQLMDTVGNKTLEAYNKVENTMGNLRQRVTSKALEVEQKVAQKVGSFVSAVRDRIYSWTHKAQEQGKDITHCVNAANAATEEYFTTLAMNSVTCVSDQMKTGEAVLDDLVDLADRANETYAEAEAALKNCDAITDSYERVVCSTKATTDAGIKESAIVQEAVGHILQLHNFSSNFISGLSSCEEKVTTNVQQHTEAVDAEFVACVQNAGVQA